MPDDGVSHIDKGKIQQLGEGLSAHAETLRACEGGLDRNIPDVPFDSFGLQAKIRQLDEERERFEARLTTMVAGAGEGAVLQVQYTEGADK